MECRLSKTNCSFHMLWELSIKDANEKLPTLVRSTVNNKGYQQVLVRDLAEREDAVELSTVNRTDPPLLNSTQSSMTFLRLKQSAYSQVNTGSIAQVSERLLDYCS